jgi:hypothetical protein
MRAMLCREWREPESLILGDDLLMVAGRYRRIPRRGRCPRPPLRDRRAAGKLVLSLGE